MAEQQWIQEAEAQKKELQTKLKLYALIGSVVIFYLLPFFFI